MQTEKGKIRLVMADDHEIFRDGFQLIVSRCPHIDLVGQAENGKVLLNMVAMLKPNVVVTDIRMPQMDGIEATRQLKTQFPDIGVIGLSMHDEEDLILEMLDAGAKGYLLKNADKAEVIEAIEIVSQGIPYYCPTTSQKLAFTIANNKYHSYPSPTGILFSEKEKEIIVLICKEFTNKEIGEKVFLSVRTVEGYRLKILEKMRVKNTVGLVVYAIQHGLYNPPK